ncbi:MAG: glycosyltransferase family 4 protein [bacterium]
MSVKKIAVIARNISGKTGTSNTILKQAQWLAEKNWDVTLIGSRINKELITHPYIHTKYIPDVRIGSYLKRRVFAAWAGLLTRNHRFSLVHGHGDSLSQDLLSLHNCVHKTHEELYKDNSRLHSGAAKIHALQLQHKKFKYLIANSKLMKDDLINRYNIFKDDITVIYPGHDPAQFNTNDKERSRKEILTKLRIPQNNFIIGFLSSGDFKKRNLFTLLNSLSLLPKNEKTAFTCIIAGYDKTIPCYINHVKKLGIADHVIFTGTLTDTAPYYKSFDVYVHPAYFEEFGQTVQEASACGAPVITTRTTGASELFKNEMKDFIVKKPDDAQKLSSMILYLMKNPIQRKKLACAAPAMVKHNTWDHNFTQVLNVYTQLMHTSN